MKKVVICCCVRDCEQYLPYIFENIKQIIISNYDISCIFVYDNCKDKSEKLLIDYRKKSKHQVFLQKIKNTSKFRTVRIAKARNKCLEILYNKIKYTDFHIMIDCDDVNKEKWNIELIKNYLENFDKDTWDCISFNRSFYYDIWSLMIDEYKHHCWGFNKPLDVINFIRKYITIKLNNCKSNSINCYSAFNGFAIYKTGKFKGIRYDGLYKNLEPYLSTEEIQVTLKLINNKNLSLKHFDMCCEHIFYHLTAIKKNNCKIKISKFLL